MTSTPATYGPDDLYDLRERVRAGEKVSPEEYKSVVEALRRSREAGGSAASRKKAAKPKVSQEQLDNLLDSFAVE